MHSHRFVIELLRWQMANRLGEHQLPRYALVALKGVLPKIQKKKTFYMWPRGV